MNLRLNLAKLTSFEANRGFSSVEAIASLIIITITLATLGSIFVNQRQSNINAQIRSLASSVAQYQLEAIRYNMRGTLPSLNESQQSVQTVVIDPTTTPVKQISLGVDVRTRDVSGVNADGSPNCVSSVVTGSRSRCVRVQVRPFSNSSSNPIIYETQTVFTDIR